MKKIVIKIVILIAVLLPVSLFAQQKTTIDGLYDKYAGKDGFTSINISSDMFAMMAGINMDDSSEDARKAQEMLKQLDGLKMLVYEPKDSGAVIDFYREIKNKIPDNKFKELMSVNSDDAKIRFLVNQDKNGKIKEFLMFVNSDGESLVMSLTGDMDMKTISEIGNAVNVPGINNLGGLVK